MNPQFGFPYPGGRSPLDAQKRFSNANQSVAAGRGGRADQEARSPPSESGSRSRSRSPGLSYYDVR